MATRKGFNPAENKLARVLVDELIKERKQPGAAKALGVSQGYLNDFKHGNRGGGGKILRGLAKLYPERAVELIGGTPLPQATAPDVVDQELSTPEAKKLEQRFLPEIEARYPGLGLPALRGLRTRPKLRGFDLRTCWEALASVRFEERGVPPTSLDLINVAQAALLDEGEPIEDDEPAPRRRRA